MVISLISLVIFINLSIYVHMRCFITLEQSLIYFLYQPILLDLRILEWYKTQTLACDTWYHQPGCQHCLELKSTHRQFYSCKIVFEWHESFIVKSSGQTSWQTKTHKDTGWKPRYRSWWREHERCTWHAISESCRYYTVALLLCHVYVTFFEQWHMEQKRVTI